MLENQDISMVGVFVILGITRTLWRESSPCCADSSYIRQKLHKTTRNEIRVMLDSPVSFSIAVAKIMVGFGK